MPVRVVVALVAYAMLVGADVAFVDRILLILVRAVFARAAYAGCIVLMPTRAVVALVACAVLRDVVACAACAGCGS